MRVALGGTKDDARRPLVAPRNQASKLPSARSEAGLRVHRATGKTNTGYALWL
jgi:hypothetical protein